MVAESRQFALLVEDDRNLSELLAAALGDEVECTHAGSAAAAIKAIHDAKGEIDVALIDVNLPDDNGVRVVDEIKLISPDTIIFLMSGNVHAEHMKLCLDAQVEGFLHKPFTAEILRQRVFKALERRKYIRERWAMLEAYEQKIEERNRSLIRSQQSTLLALAKLAESRDSETGKHLERVAHHCRTVATYLMHEKMFDGVVDEEFVDNIYLTSPLHDIGKVGIPDEVLLKPGQLTKDEFEVMKTHTVIGAGVLDKVIENLDDHSSMMVMARDVVRHHHERYDGMGYPDGVAGLEIPLAARIVSVVDNYDALRSRRVYKPAFSQNKTRRIMTDDVGKRFDPLIIGALHACESEIVETAEALADTDPEPLAELDTTKIAIS